jgi:UDP-glucose 4-epimerase
MNPMELEILGNGKQTKSYLYIDDCISGILHAQQDRNQINLFNLGSEDQLTVYRIAKIVVEEMGLDTVLRLTGGDRGWKGDVPVMLLSSRKLKNLGWKARFNSEAAVRSAIRSLIDMPSIPAVIGAGK